VSPEPETTLAWAEFLWRVVREAPETASLYIALFLFWRHSREEKGRDVTIRVPPAIAIASMPAPTLYLSPIRGTSSAHMALATGKP
jgi:hypothetical protein